MNPFETLGLEPRFDLDPSELETRYRELSRVLHPDKYAQRPAAERRMSLSRAVEVNEAYRTLKDDLSRGRALLATLGSPQPESGATGEGDAKEPPDPAFLMEVMELRESLAEARAGADAARVALLAKRVSETMRETRAAVAARFSDAKAGNDAALDEAASLLGRMRYYRRFLDEVAVIEEEALG